MSDKRRAGVLGHPIEHSLSPVLHRAAYEAMGLDWEYDAYDVASGELGGFLEQLDDSWAGLSLTMPLKVEALEHMDYIEPMAKLVGAVNTVVFSGVGTARQVVGANTDVYGVTAALREAGVKRVSNGVILGGGATASSAMAALGEMGCTRPIILVRDRSRVGGLLRAASKMGVRPILRDLAEAPGLLASADVVISTVPAVAGGDVASHVHAVLPHSVLLDVIYDPIETPLMGAWRAAGGTTVSGVRMLLQQAAEQVRLMTGRRPAFAQMQAAVMSKIPHS